MDEQKVPAGRGRGRGRARPTSVSDVPTPTVSPGKFINHGPLVIVVKIVCLYHIVCNVKEYPVHPVSPMSPRHPQVILKLQLQVLFLEVLQELVLVLVSGLLEEVVAEAEVRSRLSQRSRLGPQVDLMCPFLLQVQYPVR